MLMENIHEALNMIIAPHGKRYMKKHGINTQIPQYIDEMAISWAQTVKRSVDIT